MGAQGGDGMFLTVVADGGDCRDERWNETAMIVEKLTMIGEPVLRTLVISIENLQEDIILNLIKNLQSRKDRR